MKSDSRHLYNCIKVEPYKSKYFNVARKPVRELSDELLFVMGRVEELLDLLERQRSIWIRSTSTVTLNAIAQVQATLLAIAQGIKAEDFIFERCVAAIYGKSMISFVKAVRCPSTKDQKIVEMVKTDRQILKNGISWFIPICVLTLRIWSNSSFDLWLTIGRKTRNVY